jgi:hypothetical protein
MRRLEEYIFKVGMQTSDTMKFALHKLLSERYQQCYDREFAGKLAAEVANYLFHEFDVDAIRSDFAEENHDIIETRARELSKEDSLCQALTCAVYNFSYAKYVEDGGKVGWLFHPFLGYVRALQRNEFDVMAHFSNSKKVPPGSYLPLLHLSRLKLMRPLPWTPDSKRMLETVVAFGKSVG